jgi:hypothetical protein
MMPAIVPHLVGFHPERSVVAVGLGPDGRTVGVTMRVDIPVPGDRTPQLTRDMWTPCIGALTSVAAHDVILLLYPHAADDPWRDEDLARDLPDRDLLAEIAALLEDAGMNPLDALCVVGERWRSYWCADLRCCPTAGRTVDPEEAMRARLMFVQHGSAPLASRGELVASLEPRPDDDPLRVRVHALRASSTPPRPPVDDLVSDIDDYVAAIGRWGDDPSDAAGLERLAARAFGYCEVVPSRDLLLRALTVGGGRDLLVPTRAVLSEAVRCADLGSVAPLATVLAVCAWVSGAGAAARVALDRAVEVEPAYSLAGLVTAALDAGTPPWTWSAMMADLSVDEILEAGRVPTPQPLSPEVAAALAELGVASLDELADLVVDDADYSERYDDWYDSDAGDSDDDSDDETDDEIDDETDDESDAGDGPAVPGAL